MHNEPSLPLESADAAEMVPASQQPRYEAAIQNLPDPNDLFSVMERWNGPFASARGVLTESQKWQSLGARGAEWLTRRTTDETDLEMLSRMATVLSVVGAPAIPAIIKWLGFKASEEHQCALLQALAWMDQTKTVAHTEAVQAIICDGLKSHSYDVREKAISAAKAIPAAEARNFLNEYLVNEKHPALQKLTEETLREIRGE